MANYSKNKKYHYTYRTTNKVNGRYYLGMHSSNRIDDGYLGSGKRLYYELNKYGRDNFKFEILEHFNSREDLVEAEKQLITEQDLTNKNCLNLKLGGTGGFVSVEACTKGGSILGRLHKKRMENDSEYRESRIKLIKAVNKREVERGKHPFLSSTNRYDWKGKTHTKETKKKMSESSKEQGTGYSNSQYGTCWITNGEINKKIKRGDSIPSGYRLGRVLK